MSYDVMFSPVFERAVKRLAKKYPSIRGDLSELIDSLSKDPHTGTHLARIATKCGWPSGPKAKAVQVVHV